MVRVMARGTLIDFVANRVSPAQQAVVTKHLDAWYKTVWKAQWKSSAELKEQVSSASVLTSERVVFNIKGNDYRLIAAINFRRQILFVKWLGTHKEYDKIDAREVKYDEDRYLS
jgi:mRNA interferase HigB